MPGGVTETSPLGSDTIGQNRKNENTRISSFSREICLASTNVCQGQCIKIEIRIVIEWPGQHDTNELKLPMR